MLQEAQKRLVQALWLIQDGHHAAMCLAYDTWDIDTGRSNSIGEEGSDLSIGERQIRAIFLS